ncbi:MAG: T9SS type A sorting domain-containing protein, partial [Bacteroidetes bacterium]|nr:T9SS type A sorting domain-containing protein [Bacteroidota bacterium]
PLAGSPVMGGTYTDCEGTITYTYNYQDCSGLPFSWTYTYNVDHTINPAEFAGPVPTTSTVECASAATPPALPVVKDVCGNILTPTLASPSMSGTYTSCEGTIIYTYHYLDCSGLPFNWSFTYTIHHTTPPGEVGVPVPTANTVECSSAAVPPAVLPLVKDICGVVIPAPTPVATATPACEGSKTYTYTYLDCAGLPFVWAYTYTIDHVTAPVVPANGGSTVACVGSAVQPVSTPTLDQQQLQQMTNPNWTDCTSIGQSFTCGTAGWLTQLDLKVGALSSAVTFTLQVYQGNGISGTPLYSGTQTLSAIGWQTISIPQSVAPHLNAGTQYTFWLTSFTYNQLGLICMNPNVYNGGVAMDGCTSGCSPTYTWQQWPDYDLVFKTYMTTLPFVTDICGTAITPSAPAVTGTYNGCSGTRIYTFNYADCSGLSTPWSYTYTILPPVVTMPAAGGSTVSCPSASLVAPVPPTVLDNCGRILSHGAGVPGTTPTCNGTKTWTFTYTDCAGVNYNWVYTYTVTYSGGLAAPSAGVTTVSCPSASQVAPATTDILDACGRTVSPVLVNHDPAPLCNGDVVWHYIYTGCDGTTTVPWTYTYHVVYSGSLTAPAAGSITVSCPASSQVAPPTSTITDACGRAVSPVLVNHDPAPTCNGDVVWNYSYTACDGTTTVSWTYTYHVVYSGGLTAPANGSTTIAGTALAVNPGPPANITDACGRTVVPVLVGSTQTPSPVVCTGTIVWKYRYTACDGITTADWTYTYNITTSTLSGTLKYDNTAKTPLNNVTLRLLDAGNNQVGANVITDGSGGYIFPNLCVGTYTIEVVNNNKTVGGINSTDAGAVNGWGTTGGLIDYAKFHAGDVAVTLNFISGTDAQRIQQYFVYHTAFDRTPWTYWKKGDMILNNYNPYNGPANHPANFYAVVNGDVPNYDIYGIVTGDFNASLVPSGAKATNTSLTLTNGGSMQAGPNQDIELPVRATSSMEVGAVSMILNLPSDLVEVKDVTVNGSNEAVAFAVNGNELRIGWNSVNPVEVSENGTLLVLKLRTTSKFTTGQSIVLSLTEDPLNELADASFNVIEGAELLVNQVDNGMVGIHPVDANPLLTLSNYPNPFSDWTTVKYSIPVNGKVSIDLYNPLGQHVASLVDAAQSAGQYSIRYNGSQLSQGIYSAILRLTDGKVEMVRTIKFNVHK